MLEGPAGTRIQDRDIRYSKLYEYWCPDTTDTLKTLFMVRHTQHKIHSSVENSWISISSRFFIRFLNNLPLIYRRTNMVERSVLNTWLKGSEDFSILRTGTTGHRIFPKNLPSLCLRSPTPLEISGNLEIHPVSGSSLLIVTGESRRGSWRGPKNLRSGEYWIFVWK